MKKKSFTLILWLILLLAFGLRFYKLGSLLPLFGDEVDNGYNAYSILKTGKDVTGHFLPIFLKTLIDTKSSLLAYLTTIPVFFFGLNDLTIRIIPALVGVLSVVLVFLISLRLSANKLLALSASFLMAITPWAIHFSRGVWEANLMLFLLLLGIWTLLKSSENKNYFYLSAVSFGLSFYAYHSAKVLTPLIILGIIIFFKEFFKRINKKTIILSLVVFLLIALPNFYAFLFAGGQERFSQTSLFKDSKIIDQIVTKRGEDLTSPFSRFFHNKGEAYFNKMAASYLESFSPQFLFLYGDANFRHSSGASGEILLICLPFFLIGLFIAFKERKKYQKFLIYCLLISPLPSIITQDGGQHAIRLLFLLPVVLVITALGFSHFVSWFEKEFKKSIQIIVYVLLIAFLIFELMAYAHQYFSHYPKESWRYWPAGYKQAMLGVKKLEGNYKEVFINNSYEPSILWFLFWQQYPPEKFQKSLADLKNQENIFSGMDGFRLDKFYFFKINQEGKQKGILGMINDHPRALFLVSQEKDVGGDWDWQKTPPGGIKVLEKIVNPYQQPIFYLVTHE